MEREKRGRRRSESRFPYCFDRFSERAFREAADSFQDFVRALVLVAMRIFAFGNQSEFIPFRQKFLVVGIL